MHCYLCPSGNQIGESLSRVQSTGVDGQSCVWPERQCRVGSADRGAQLGAAAMHQSASRSARRWESALPFQANSRPPRVHRESQGWGRRWPKLAAFRAGCAFRSDRSCANGSRPLHRRPPPAAPRESPSAGRCARRHTHRASIAKHRPDRSARDCLAASRPTAACTRSVPQILSGGCGNRTTCTPWCVISGGQLESHRAVTTIACPPLATSAAERFATIVSAPPTSGQKRRVMNNTRGGIKQRAPKVAGK